MSPKRAKPDDSSSDSSPSQSASSMITDQNDKQLDEISAKLSLILTAVQDLTDAVRQTNNILSPKNTETAVIEIKNVIKELDKKININHKIQEESINIEMNENDNIVEAEAMRIKSNKNYFKFMGQKIKR